MNSKLACAFEILRTPIIGTPPIDKPAEPTEPDTRNPAAVALSKLGASKGGKALAKALGPKKSVQIAKNAAKTRLE